MLTSSRIVLLFLISLAIILPNPGTSDELTSSKPVISDKLTPKPTPRKAFHKKYDPKLAEFKKELNKFKGEVKRNLQQIKQQDSKIQKISQKAFDKENDAELARFGKESKEIQELKEKERTIKQLTDEISNYTQKVNKFVEDLDSIKV